MSEERPDPKEQPRPPAAWPRWLALFAIAAMLLSLSQVIWTWQTWPVRNLLFAPAAVVPLAATS